MKRIILQPLVDEIPAINFVGVKLEDWIGLSTDQIGGLRLPSSTDQIAVGDIWSVNIESLDDQDLPALVLHGDCQRVHCLGHQHRRGQIIVQGNIGDHCGACMTGGSIRVHGNAGRNLGATVGTRGTGMNGGVLQVAGHAGDLAGHRMRRGELTIQGDAGDGLASWQVAGTIRVGGTTGQTVAYGMRRGTLILEKTTTLPVARFTQPVELHTPFLQLFDEIESERRPDSTRQVPATNPRSSNGLRWGDRPWIVSRGDRSIGGIGEVWMPGS